MMRTDAEGSWVFRFASLNGIYPQEGSGSLWCLIVAVCTLVCFLLSPKSLISLLHLAATLLSLQHTCTLGRAVVIFFSLHADGSHILLSGLARSLHLSLTSQHPPSLEGLIKYQTKANAAAGHPWATWETEQGGEEDRPFFFLKVHREKEGKRDTDCRSSIAFSSRCHRQADWELICTHYWEMSKA